MLTFEQVLKGEYILASYCSVYFLKERVRRRCGQPANENMGVGKSGGGKKFR